ncbi:zinc dependent phospholipase C family protein [Deinococcus frigens]|uniref:zinc dependent phospholipase C family protein n=1 Tax=Deinococcus frigens TaxID=249403 RepID=UPI000496D726|nr:zinc dependent phospholipase C family protein [Deinococcus frigens]
MGTWISHFRIAEQLLEHLPHLAAEAFIVGNIAPDSGRPNADWTAFDPPKTVTHFLRAGEDEGRIRDVQFYREYVLPAEREDRQTFSFILGYFTHLVSDNLWMHLIGQPTKETFAAEFSADRAATWDHVKDDWYGLDHKYLRDFPDNVFARAVVNAVNPASPLPFLPSGALADRLDDLRTFYRHPGDMVLDRPYPYLSEATMNRVVDDSARIISELLARLEAGGVPKGAEVSLPGLDLPAPYALP